MHRSDNSGLVLIISLGVESMSCDQKDHTKSVVSGFNRIKSDNKNSTPLEAIQASDPPGLVFELDLHGNIVYLNEQCREWLGFENLEDRAAVNIFDYIHPDDVEKAKLDYQMVLDDQCSVYRDYSIRLAPDSVYPLLVNMMPVIKSGQVVGIRGIAFDFKLKKELEGALYSIEERLLTIYGEVEQLVEVRTRELSEANARLREEIEERTRAEEKLKDSLQEREVLLKEIHHRVKNNLQVVVSLFNLQMDRVDNPDLHRIIRECGNRTASMAIIHETLYQTDNMASVKLDMFLLRLVTNLFQSYRNTEGRIFFNCEADGVSIDFERAVPMSLILNELISNSLKYAFPDGGKGLISINARESDEGGLTITVGDNGVGLPEGFDWSNASTLGLTLVKGLVGHQLKGTIELKRDNGTEYTIYIGAKGKNKK